MKNFTQRVFGLAILFIFSFTILKATSISYGDDIEAKLDNTAEVDIYTFEGKIGHRVFIRARDAESPVDACIKLYSPSGLLVGDHCRDGGIVVLKDVELIESGTYEIHFNDNNDNDTGTYGLSLELLNSSEYSNSISCGDDLLDKIEKTVQINSYHFYAKAGEIAIFQMRSSNKSLESEIEIYDEQGNLLDADYSSHLARIKEFKFPADGTYKILLTDYNGNDKGEYGFSFQVVNRPECGNMLLCNNADFSTEGSYSSDIKQLAQMDAYFLKADVGQSVVIQLYSNVKGFDGEMKLYDLQGNILASTEAKYGLLRIEYNEFKEKGFYMIVVGDNNGKDFSDYEIKMQRVDNGGCATDVGCSDILQEGKIKSKGGMNTFSFSALAESSIKIVVDPDDKEGLDPRLELFTPSGTKIFDKMSWDIVYSGEIILPEDGEYTIMVSDHNGNDEGAFMIGADIPGMVDTQNPVINCAGTPYNAQLVGEEIVLVAEDLVAGVTDNCGAVELTLATTTLNCSNLGDNLIEVTATDDSGNKSTCMVKVILHDLGGVCPQEYCESKGYKSDFEWIESVAIGEQVFVSDGNDGYYDFSDEVVSLYRNVDYTMVLTPGLQGNEKRYWRIWIDWNRDGDFEDEGEFRGQAKSRKTISHTFSVPDYASDKSFKMRVAIKHGAYPELCEVYDYGEVEDFLLEVNEDKTCSTLPVDWKGTDIGTTPIPGSVCYEEATNTYNVTGSGDDIFDEEDDFYFVFTELCGDGDIVAQINNLSSIGEYALGGIMFRQNLNNDSKYVGILASNDHGLISQVRKANGADTKFEKHAGEIPSWVKIERRGNDFTGFLSVDGVSWEKVFSYELNMADCMNVGLAVASNNPNHANTVVFNKVEVVPFDGANGEADDRSNEENNSNNLSSKSDISIAPNPAGDFTWVDCNDCIGKEVILSIFNIEGKLVYTNQIENATTKIYTDLREANLPNGQYFLSLKSTGFVATQKLLIAK